MLSKQLSFKAIKETDFFAEVIESSLSSFLAQCWKWDDFPQFGNLVQIKQKNITILGCVTQIKTGSMDPMRYPFTYQKTEEQLLAEQPQIFEFLKTTFSVQIVGYKEKKRLYYLLPSNPCKIHSFVEPANYLLVEQFFKTTDFLHLLFASSQQEPSLDEILLAIVKDLKNYEIFTSKFLEDFCQTFSFLTGNDYRRLKLFLQRIEGL